MKMFETSISVNTDGSAVIELKLPDNVSPGMHRAVVVVEEQPVTTGHCVDKPLDLLPMTFEGWPKDCTFRREDLYGDNGR
jgi:hypothetical protein